MRQVSKSQNTRRHPGLNRLTDSPPAFPPLLGSPWITPCGLDSSSSLFRKTVPTALPVSSAAFLFLTFSTLLTKGHLLRRKLGNLSIRVHSLTSYKTGLKTPLAFHSCSLHSYLCKSICLFVPSSFCCCCFDVLMLTASDGLESAALFLPLPAPPVGAAALSFSAEAAAALGGRPRRLTGDASVPETGVTFWLASCWEAEKEKRHKTLHEAPGRNNVWHRCGLTFFTSSFLITGFSLFSCARLSDDSVAVLLLLQDTKQKPSVESNIFHNIAFVSLWYYLFLLTDEELSGEELVLVLLAVSEAVVVFVKILLPGTVRGLFTAANTGAVLGYMKD